MITRHNASATANLHTFNEMEQQMIDAREDVFGDCGCYDKYRELKAEALSRLNSTPTHFHVAFFQRLKLLLYIEHRAMREAGILLV